ncbi:uncharacterized protein LOC133823224 isoform X2 [Humulus lupulus]|uniref:uncharacterized protein LOC133823224 isoform X2 n=1 Tax=Humulus lupulus TaxID=3486 RepID=UPI002B400654|nr:uncharacterized protein LOC133823224 isoform X2 [Humulus lupulus]
MKRQDSLPSSSSHRENDNVTEKLHAKAVGCMSGLFHFVSNYHGRRKLLTFGKRQAKNEVVPTTTKSSKSIDKDGKISTANSSINVLQRYSCEVPRSPTLPAEIRRSNSVNSPQNFKTPPAGVVARLMGLEEPHSSTTESTIMSKASTLQKQLSEYSSAAEKRRQLLGALEKCDRDLQALKKIINAVRSVERYQSPATAAVFRNSQEVKGLEVNINNNPNAEQPSPVSVLDDSTRSPLSNSDLSKRQSFSYGRVQHQVRQQKRKPWPGEEDFISPSIFDRITCESLHRKAIVSIMDYSHRAEPAASSPPPSSLPSPSSSPLWNSEAMKESVEEVCKDINWGERREIGRIGLALQDHICRDLIEEIVTDMSSLHFYNNLYSPLPFEACKRRLCF